MNKSLFVAVLLAMTGTAHAEGIPQLNYGCPEDISVHADEGGPIFINGEEADTKKFSDTYYEAKGGGVTVSIMLTTDGSADVSFTGAGGANGVCQPSEG